MAPRYYEIHTISEYYYDIDIDETLEIDFLARRRSALEMVISQIESLISDRRNLFSQHKDGLEKKISELHLRLKELMPGNQLIYPGQAVFELEKHRIDLEKELRGHEVQFMQDIIHLQDRLRDILLNHGNLLAIGGENSIQRQRGSSGSLQKVKASSGEKDR